MVQKKMKFKIVLCFLLVVGFCLLLFGCQIKDRAPVDTNTAIDYISELHYYVEETGDTDIYLWLLEGMDYDYLKEYLEETLSDSFEEGYQKGFSDGTCLILDFMDEKTREKWFVENADIVEEYDISY